MKVVCVGLRGKAGGPGDVTMAGGVARVAAFAEDPFCAGIGFAEGKVVCGDVEFALGESLFGDGELVHQAETEVMLFAREIHRDK